MIQNSGESEVLTVNEAAEFLRVTPDVVERLIADKSLPARRVEGEWRLSREAIHYWLVTAESKDAMLKSAGVFRDDPTLTEVLSIIERNRKS